MPVPPIPPPMEALRNRPFSFYPALLGIEHNEWRYRKATWSEVLVVNARTGQEVWIPRRFLGEIARIEDPVVIVGLVQELEYKSGAVWPYQRRVIEMPMAVGGGKPVAVAQRRNAPAQVVGIRLESKTDSHLIRLVGGALVAGIVAAYVVVNFYRDVAPRPRLSYSAKDRSYLELTVRDDYASTIRKLGEPARVSPQRCAGGVPCLTLAYPIRGYTVVLTGAARQQAGYIGTVDENGHTLHTVPLAQGGWSDVLLRGLRDF